jgi:hypothetical protein
LTALLSLPASAATVPVDDMLAYKPGKPSTAQACPPTAAQMAADRVRTSNGQIFHKLTELPPADAYSAVYRVVDGCEAPIVIRYGVTGLTGSAHK